MTLPSAVLAAAQYLERAGIEATAAGFAAAGFPVEAQPIQGHRYTVWRGAKWVLKYLHASDRREERWRRTPAQQVAFYDGHRSGRDAAFLPVTHAFGDRIVVQERADPDPRRYRRNNKVLQDAGRRVGIGNINSDNIGWRGAHPFLLDVEYLGPDLTVVLLWKRTTKGRHAQGEATFWAQWGPQYLARMVRNLRRHLPADTRIVVMTDDASVVPDGCDIAPLTEDHPGWWSKLWQFRADVTCGRVLYLDLDNVVCGPMRDLLALTPDPMIVPDDRQMPGLPNGGAMLYFAERVRYLWDTYAADPLRWQQQFHESRWPHASDQAYIAARLLEREGRYMPFFQDLLGDGYVLNSRVELEDGADWSRCQLVVGCWTPKPHESQHPFYLKHWAA